MEIKRWGTIILRVQFTRRSYYNVIFILQDNHNIILYFDMNLVGDTPTFFKILEVENVI